MFSWLWRFLDLPEYKEPLEKKKKRKKAHIKLRDDFAVEGGRLCADVCTHHFRSSGLQHKLVYEENFTLSHSLSLCVHSHALVFHATHNERYAQRRPYVQPADWH